MQNSAEDGLHKYFESSCLINFSYHLYVLNDPSTLQAKNTQNFWFIY